MAGLGLGLSQPRVEFDQEVMSQHQAFLARRDGSKFVGGVEARSIEDQGIHLIVQPRNPGDSQSSATVADTIAEHLTTQFQPFNPEYSMEEAFQQAKERGLAQHSIGVMATAVRFYPETTKSKNLNGVVAGIGIGPVYWYRRKRILGVPLGKYTSTVVSPHPGVDEENYYLTSDPGSMDRVRTKKFKPRIGDRVVLATRAVVETPEGQHRLENLDLSMEGQQIADSIVEGPTSERDRVAIYIEFEKKKKRMAPAVGTAAVAASATAPPSSSGGAAAVTVPQRTSRNRFSWQSIKDRYLDPSAPHHRKPLGRFGSVGLAPLAYVNRKRQERYDRQMMKNRTHRRYDASVTVEERDTDFRKRTRRRGAVVAGALMAVPALTYLFAGDPGEGADIDKGWDALGIPFDRGDIGEGDGNRVDYNWNNMSPSYNDDPTRAHFDTDGNLDIFPSFIDGDGTNLWDWMFSEETQAWDPGDTNLPNPREEPAGGGDRGPDSGNGPLGNIPEAVARAAEEAAERARQAAEERARNSGAAAPFVVEAGSGFVREIDEYADMTGHSISREEAFRLYAEARTRLGDGNMIVGTGTYVSPAGDLRLSNPAGNAHWTDDMRRFLDEQLQNAG